MHAVSRFLPVLLLGFCLPEPAQASFAPTIFFLGYLMILAVLPIIGVEAGVLLARLDIGFVEALGISGVANIVSAIIGVPVAWLLGGTVEKIASSLLPRSNAAWKRLLDRVVGSLVMVSEKYNDWVIPSVVLILLVPFFFLSWLIEFQLVSNMLEEEADSTRVLGAVFLANLVSHALLGIVQLFEFSRAGKSFSAAIHEAREICLIDGGLAPDGRIFTADQHGTIRFFDADTGRQVQALGPVRAEMRCEAVSSDGRFAVGMDNRDQEHVVWEYATKREVCRLEDDDYFEYAVVFSPNGSLLAANTESVPAFRLWSCDTGNLVGSLDDGHSIAFSPTSPIVAVAGEDEVVLLDRQTCDLVHTIDGPGGWAKFSPDGRYLALAVAYSALISIYNSVAWNLTRTLEADATGTAIADMTFSPDTTQLAVASSDGKVRLMNVDTGKCDSETSIEHSGRVLLAFTPDCGQLIVVQGAESIMRLPLEGGRFLAPRQH